MVLIHWIAVPETLAQSLTKYHFPRCRDVPLTRNESRSNESLINLLVSVAFIFFDELSFFDPIPFRVTVANAISRLTPRVAIIMPLLLENMRSNDS